MQEKNKLHKKVQVVDGSPWEKEAKERSSYAAVSRIAEKGEIHHSNKNPRRSIKQVVHFCFFHSFVVKEPSISSAKAFGLCSMAAKTNKKTDYIWEKVSNNFL